MFDNLTQEEIEKMTDSELKAKYNELDSNTRSHKLIVEMEKRGLKKGKNNPKDGNFNSIERL